MAEYLRRRKNMINVIKIQKNNKMPSDELHKFKHILMMYTNSPSCVSHCKLSLYLYAFIELTVHCAKLFRKLNLNV